MIATDNRVSIVLETVSDLGHLFRWRDDNLIKVLNYNHIHRSGVIEYGECGAYRQKFNVINDGIVQHNYLSGRDLQGFGFDYDRYTMEFLNIIGDTQSYPVDHAKQDAVSIHATSMAILEHAKHFVRMEGSRIWIRIEG